MSRISCRASSNIASDVAEPFLRGLGGLRPGAEQALRQELEVGLVVATRGEMDRAGKADPGRTGIRGAPARPGQRLAPEQVPESARYISFATSKCPRISCNMAFLAKRPKSSRFTDSARA